MNKLFTQYQNFKQQKNNDSDYENDTDKDKQIS